ncbi:MAG: hypothetical protein ACO1NZ_04365 [Adhaeribacter sp.]
MSRMAQVLIPLVKIIFPWLVPLPLRAADSFEIVSLNREQGLGGAQWPGMLLEVKLPDPA